MNRLFGASLILIAADTWLLSLAFKADIEKQALELDSPLGFAFIVAFVLSAFFCAVNIALSFISWRGMLKYDTDSKINIRDIFFRRGDAASCNIIKGIGFIAIFCTLVWVAASALSSLWYHLLAGIIFIPILLLHMLSYLSFMKAKGMKK